MQTTSLDMVRQSGFDLWLLVCAAAAIGLASYLFVGRLWADPRQRVAAVLSIVGVSGTVLILALPVLHNAKLGLVWTFLLLADLSTVFYLNLRWSLSNRQTGLLLGMRLAALMLLVPMLFEPVVRYVTVPRPERPLLFVVDTSGSMSVPDVQNGPTRIQSVWQAMRGELPSIESHFVPQFFTFDTDFRELKRADDLATAAADGKSTDIVNAVSQALAKATRPDAAVVLITDGIDNTSPNVIDAVRGSAHAVHTIRVGSEKGDSIAVANVAVDDLAAPDDLIVRHESPIKATIRSTGFNNRVVDVHLSEVDADGKPIGTPAVQKLVLEPTTGGQTVELPYKPMTPGLHRVAVWIDPIAGERSTADNRQEFQAMAVDPRIKVLYIEGSIRLEYKYNRQAFLSDANVELATYLRTTATEFRPNGTVDGEPFKGIPATKEQWKKFDVVVIGDIDSSYLSPAAQQQIEQFTADGGGLLMLGGQNSFGPGGYGGTPIEKALPTFAGDKVDAQDKSPFVPVITSDGQTHPVLEGLTDWFTAGQRKPDRTLPTVNGNVVAGKPKAGGQVLLTHADKMKDGLPETVLAVERYGQGRSAAFTVDTTYLWYLPLRTLGQDSPYNKFWGQLIRWLAGQDVRNRRRGAGVDAVLNKSTYQLGEPVRIRAYVRDEHGDSTKYAQTSATITDPAGKAKTITLDAVESQPGLFEATIRDAGKGSFKVAVAATKDGKPLGDQSMSFTVLPPADEMLKVAANPQLLIAIADETHGLHYDLGQFSSFIDQLERTDPTAGRPQQRAVPLSDYVRSLAELIGFRPAWSSAIDLPVQGFILISVLITEWILRRRWQLM